MKIDINKIPLEGLTLEENLDPSSLDLETDIVTLLQPVNIKAAVSRITNAVTVNLNLNGMMRLSCSRCLDEFYVSLNKALTLNYQVDGCGPIIDLDQEIKEEIILDYPIKPLCSPGCKGLCPKCGKNLNEGGCSCATT
ncbi:MAG: DUF177 domain-containing protein [Candidatus Omnitrophota bacterium]